MNLLKEWKSMGRLYKARKAIFLMMLDLLLFQYVAPVAAVAEVLMQKNAQMTLVEAKKGEADNQIALSVDIEAGETAESLKIQSSEKIFSSVVFADTSTTDTVSLHDTQDSIRLSVQPADESVSKTILLTIKDSTSLKNGTVDFTYQDQTISYRLPDQYVAADQTTTTTSEATDRTDTTTSESDTTTPSSEESNRSDRAAVSSAGAIFKVVDETGAIVAENLASNEAGLVTVDDLAPGQYSYVETQAPTGYLINDQEISFEIANSATEVPAVVEAGTMIDYQGSATLLKTDEDNTPLAGAIFKVIDETGATVADNLASNEEGIVAVDGLAPGQYSFVETQAPTGYQISDEAIKFVIASHAAGQPTEVDAGQLINHLMPNTPNTPNTPEKPSGKLPKTNDTSNRWLALIGGSIVVLTSTAGFYFNKKRKS